ncbi:Acetyltransferase [Thalassocella blandensis]|nr:Acetyltransferase [Thalassocella blandensis]
MNIQILKTASDDTYNFLIDKIEVFNVENGESHQRLPLIVTMDLGDDKILGGAIGWIVGNWLLVDVLWIEEAYRGKGFGKRIISLLESKAIKKGCRQVLLDTLDFQALNFYLKLGYEVVSVLTEYPVNGTKYYLKKNIRA